MKNIIIPFCVLVGIIVGNIASIFAMVCFQKNMGLCLLFGNIVGSIIGLFVGGILYYIFNR